MTALHQNTKKHTKQAQPLFYDTKREQSLLSSFKEPLNKWPRFRAMISEISFRRAQVILTSHITRTKHYHLSPAKSKVNIHTIGNFGDTPYLSPCLSNKDISYLLS